MNNTPKPGDFPIGSMDSRAAMRAMIERSKEPCFRVRLVMAGHPHGDCNGRWCYGVPCRLAAGRFFIADDGEVEDRTVVRVSKHDP